MENINVSPVPTAMRWGLILGGAAIITSSVNFMAGGFAPENMDSMLTKLIQYGMYALIILVLVLAMQNHRDKELGGFITWKQGFVMVFLIGLFGALIYMTYYIVIVSLDKQNFIDTSIEKLTEGIEKMRGYISDEEALAKIEDSLTEGIEKIKSMSPFQFGLNQLTNSIIAIVLVGLIVPALLKKKDPNSFE